MAKVPRWAATRRFPIVAGAGAAVVVAGIVLAVILVGGHPPTGRPATAAAGSSGTSSAGGADDDTAGARSSTTGGDASAPSGPGPVSTSSVTASRPPGGTGPGPLKVTVSCAVAAGDLDATVSLSACTQPQTTGGSGSLAGSVLVAPAGTGAVTWDGTGTTTFVYVSSHPVSQRRKCPAGDSEITVKGSVVGDDAVGPGNAGVKGAVHAKLCVDAHLDVSLAPGHTFQW